MFRREPNSQAPNRWKILLGILCIALVCAVGTIELTHTHAQANVSSAGCSLCATAHVVVASDAPPLAAPALRVVAAVVARLQAVRPRTLSQFALFTRPPPVDAALS
jgi:hypothetical protein